MSNNKKIIAQGKEPEGQSLEKLHKKANTVRIIIVIIAAITIAVTVTILLFQLFKK